MQGKVATLRDADSITNINKLSFGLENTTYTTVQRELRSQNFLLFQKLHSPEILTAQMYGISNTLSI
jgi:hypothetical protein